MWAGECDEGRQEAPAHIGDTFNLIEFGLENSVPPWCRVAPANPPGCTESTISDFRFPAGQTQIRICQTRGGSNASSRFGPT